jgi:hypothetical protein
MRLDVRTSPSILQERNGQALRVNVSAPYGGLNTRDSESNMEQTDAIVLENLIPEQGSVKSRNGHIEYCSGLSGNVETLIEHFSSNTRKFLACHGGKISDITNTSSITELGTGYTNNRWQTVAFNGYTLFVNGQDNPIKYNGSTISANAINPTGGTASSLNGINIFKNTVYVWDTNNPYFWHGAVNAIAGTFAKFDLSYVCPDGGNLLKMITISRDGGAGVDDYCAFIMSNGYAIVYEGDDPSKVAQWALVGVYKIGKPMSIRSFCKTAGDVAILTNQDFILFSTALSNEGQPTENTKLSGAVQSTTQNYSGNYGWEVLQYPKKALLFFNVPVITNQTYHQYGFNTITGAGFKFTGLNAFTWAIYNDNLYFGGSGKVYKADTGTDDNGTYINCIGQTAYSNLGSPAEKTINSYRNTIKIDGSAIINSIVNYDYDKTSAKQTNSIQALGAEWDIAEWDLEDWSPENQTQNKLVYSSGQGVDISMRIEANLKGQQLSWYRTDYSVNVNNIL